MRRLFKFLLSFIITIVVICVLFVSTFCILFYKDDHIDNSQIKEENRNIPTIIDNTMFEGLNSIDDESKDLKVLFSTYDLEAIFYSIISSIDLTNKPIKFNGVKVYLENNQYNIDIGVKVYSFPTQVHALLDIKENNGSFEISLVDVKLAKVGMVGGLTKFFLSKINKDDIEQNLQSNYQLYLDIDLENLKISLTKENIIKTIDAYVQVLPELSIMKLLTSIFLNNHDLLEFNFGENEAIGAILHLKDAYYNKLTLGELPYTYDFASEIEKEEKLLEEKVITLEQVSPVFDFLINGYSNMEETNKDIIDSINFSSIGIYSNKLYTGIIHQNNKNLNDYCSEKVVDLSSLVIDGKLGFEIQQSNLNDVLKNLPIIGKGSLFKSKDNQLAYLIIEQFNINCKIDQAILDLIININGTQVYLEIDLSCQKSLGYRINGTISSANIGKFTLTKDQQSDLIKYIDATLQQQNIDWIKVNSKDETISFDLEDALISNSKIKELIDNNPNVTTTTSFIEGAIKIEYQL